MIIHFHTASALKSILFSREYDTFVILFNFFLNDYIKGRDMILLFVILSIDPLVGLSVFTLFVDHSFSCFQRTTLGMAAKLRVKSHSKLIRMTEQSDQLLLLQNEYSFFTLNFRANPNLALYRIEKVGNQRGTSIVERRQTPIVGYAMA